MANRSLGAALSRLARDKDGEARLRGAQIAARVAAYVFDAAAEADAATSKSRRLCEKDLPALARRIDAAQARIESRGVRKP